MRKFIRVLTLIVCLALFLGFVACDTHEESTESQSEYVTEIDSESEKQTESQEESSDITENQTETETETESETETEKELIAEITEGEDGAAVVTEKNLSYTAKNYSSVDDGHFVINQGFEIVFDEALFADDFNRFKIEYEATEPIRMTATYLVDGEEFNDVFYIEAIKNEFRCFIDAYVDEKNGTELRKLTFDTCEEVDANFVLYNLSTEVVPFCEDDICIEDDRFKIGIRLSWGGAMTYYEDKADGIDDLGNLVNIHDTGRLIQQSFYGTKSNGEYVSGVYSDGTAWPYNPVQGGNKYQSGRAKLIDLEVGEDYIYVLAQSLDWALDNVLTYCYYENKYMLKDGYVLVDNVATDFSGWIHPTGGQEIPAVYLVGYFDTLVYYNGVEPWTGGELISKGDIGNWSDSYNPPFVHENTETWAAWVNTADGFSIGIYMPNVDKLIAIRHKHNGSKDPLNNSTVYVAPSNSIVMKSYVPISYSYILTSGTVEEVRDVFEENKDFTENLSLNDRNYGKVPSKKIDMVDIDFTSEENTVILSRPYNCSVSYDAEEKAVKMTLDHKSDPYVSLDFEYNSNKTLYAEDYNAIEIEYKIPLTNQSANYYTTLFYCSGSVKNANDDYTVSSGLVADGEYHMITLLFPKNKWSGEIHRIRYDFFHAGAVGDSIYVKSIKLLKVSEIQFENDMTVSGNERIFASAKNTAIFYSEEEEATGFKVTNPHDVNVIMDFSHFEVQASRFSALEIEYMVPKSSVTATTYAEVFFKTEYQKDYAQKMSAGSKIICDGEYHTMTFSFEDKEGWTGVLTDLRFDYFSSCPDEAVMYVKSIKLIESEYVTPFGDLTKEEGVGVFGTNKSTTVEYSADEEAVKFTVLDPYDPQVPIDMSKIDVSADDCSLIEIVYMIPATNAHKTYGAQIFFNAGDGTGISEKKSVRGTLIADGKYHSVVISFDGKTEWFGKVKTLRFDYFSQSKVGDVMYIKSITMLK